MDRLTEEELILIIDKKLIKKYDLLEMYSITEKGPPPVCSSCGIILKTDGTMCKQCLLEYQRQYVKNNKERIKEYSKKYRRVKADLYYQYMENGF